jgi:alanyl-tRNA synthetase
VLVCVVRDRWLETVIPLIGGKSGGKELVAQTRGDAPAKTDEAVALALKYAQDKLGE